MRTSGNTSRACEAGKGKIFTHRIIKGCSGRPVAAIAPILTFLLVSNLASPKAFAQIAQPSHTHRNSPFYNLDKRDLIDLIGKFLHPGDSINRSAPAGTVLFSFLPVAPSSATDGAVTISAVNASFYLGRESNLSTIFFYPYTNFTGSYGVLVAPNIWLDKNEWNATGDLRYLNNFLNDYGLGVSPNSRLGSVEYQQVRIYLAGYSRIRNFFYAGTGYNVDYFYNIRQSAVASEPGSQTGMNGYPPYSQEQVVSSGFTANILRDDRKNSVNPANGFFYNVIYRVNRQGLGSTYSWTSVFADVRHYVSFSDVRHKVLAMRAMYWGTYGDVPYLNMPATFQDPGGGRAGRGYSTNRYRGKEMLFAETEYRFDITRHGFLGATVFANAQSYTEPSGKFESVAPAAGVGMRLKFNRNSETNIALDCSYGRDGFHFNVNLGEYF